MNESTGRTDARPIHIPIEGVGVCSNERMYVQ